MEKLFKAIERKKKDKTAIISYIKCFVESEKTEELFRSNSEYLKIKNFLLKTQQNEKKDF